MKEKRKVYIVSAAISLGTYFISSSVGTLINVCICFASGYSRYADFQNSNNVAGKILVVLFGLINHVFFSWLTVKFISKYAKKQQWHIMKVYFVSVIAVLVYAFIACLLGVAPGIIIISIHIAGIVLFGLYAIKHQRVSKPKRISEVSYERPKETTEPVLKSESNSPEQTTPPQTIYCHICGCTVPTDSLFCHKCGTKLR